MIFSGFTFPLTIAALFIGCSVAGAQISQAPQNAPTSGNEIRPEGEIPAPPKRGRQSVKQTLPSPVEAQSEDPAPPNGRGGRQSVKQTSPSNADDPSVRSNLPDGQQGPGISALAETDPPPKDFSACKSIGEMIDRDGDFQRNQQALSSDELCLQMDIFREGGLHWVLQIVQNKKRPGGFLWFVPHDNENDAFDSAVEAVKKFGGVVVAVETGGSRYNGSQDPNRNFDPQTGKKCREQLAASPVYTERIKRWFEEGARIFALHTNERGYNGDGNGGAGGISIARPLPGNKAFRAKTKPGQMPLGLSPDDTVVFVASRVPPETDTTLMQSIEVLRDNQINVLYETVSDAHNDCSFSNYAALNNNMRNYFNIEVVQSDGPTQKEIIDRIVKLLPAGIGALAPSSGNGLGNKKPLGGGPAAELAPDPRQPRQPPAVDQTNMQMAPPAQPDTTGNTDSAPGTFRQLYNERISPEPRSSQPSRSVAGKPATPEQTATAQPGDVRKQAGGFYAQLGSPVTQADAKKTQDNLRLRFPDLVSKKPLSIQEHVDENKVVHYRVLLGPFSNQKEVVGICETLKAKQTDCAFAKL
jgi:hypothetical protein